MQAKTFAIFVSIVVMLIIINLIRRQKMTFKYSVLWLTTGVLAVVFAIWDSWLGQISNAMGFALPSNFVFFCLLAFLLLQSLFLTIYLNQQNTRLEALAQAIAILSAQDKKDDLKK